METTNLLLPSTRMTRMGMVNPTFIEDAVIVSEKEQKKKIPMKKKYTDYYFVLSINCQHAAGKYSYYIWMEKRMKK